MVFAELRGLMCLFLGSLVRAQLVGLGDKVAVVTTDVVACTAPTKHRLYGFGSRCGVRYVLSPAICQVLRQVHPDLSISGEALSVINDILVDFLERILQKARAVVTVAASHNAFWASSGPAAGPEIVQPQKYEV